MPPANPSTIHILASGVGRLAMRNVGEGLWYIAIDSGTSLSHPNRPWINLPISPFA